MKTRESSEPDVGAESLSKYEQPELGELQPIDGVTLFSGTINPDGGVVDFGDG